MDNEQTPLEFGQCGDSNGGFVTETNPMGSMGLVYLRTFSIKINYINVCKYTSPMDPMGMSRILGVLNITIILPSLKTNSQLGPLKKG